MENFSPIRDLALLSKGDQAAFERLYKAYWGRVYHFTSLYIKDSYEREEIVQEVFIRLWDMRRRIAPDRDPNGLLFIITRNLVFNRSHRSANERAMKEALIADEESSTEMEEQMEADDLEYYLDSMVAFLPKRQREAFTLSHKLGLNYKEIAEHMQISEKGVERNLYLARKFLKESLPLFLLFLGL